MPMTPMKFWRSRTKAHQCNNQYTLSRSLSPHLAKVHQTSWRFMLVPHWDKFGLTWTPRKILLVQGPDRGSGVSAC